MGGGQVAAIGFSGHDYEILSRASLSLSLSLSLECLVSFSPFFSTAREILSSSPPHRSDPFLPYQLRVNPPEPSGRTRHGGGGEGDEAQVDYTG